MIKVLLFVHDGTGLGHLKRLSRIAAAVSDIASCVIMTGHPAASLIVRPGCELLTLPCARSTGGRLRESSHADTSVLTWDERVRLRNRILQDAADVFKPDFLVVDHLPSGKWGELNSVLNTSGATKYLIWRGILGDAGQVQDEMFPCGGREALEHKYSRILIACDRSICDVASEYSLPDSISAKCEYLGYVAPSPISRIEREAIRAQRGVYPGTKWVVCSAGGGAVGYACLRECISLVRLFPDTIFDICMGPYSECSGTDMRLVVPDCDRVRLHRASSELEAMHMCADVVISAGGYNSLLEALSGRATVVCYPYGGTSDEQFVHAFRLRKKTGRITILESPEELFPAVSAALDSRTRLESGDWPPIDMCGADAFRSTLLRDAGLN